MKIKFREPFRPFAPSVLVERAEEYFALPDAGPPLPGPVHALRRGRPRRQARRHPGGHARGRHRAAPDRPRGDRPRYHRLIERFGKATGVPVLLNTSFNLKGEPIVNTPAEALTTFARSGMDVLVLGDCVVEKRATGGPGAVKPERAPDGAGRGSPASSCSSSGSGSGGG